MNPATTLKERDNASYHKLDIPVDSLYEHFKKLHSIPILSTSSTNLTSVIYDTPRLEEVKNIHDCLDCPI